MAELKQVINGIFEKVKTDIINGQYPTYNQHFYRGYCAAIEDLNLWQRGKVWNEVNRQASQFCEERRRKIANSLF